MAYQTAYLGLELRQQYSYLVNVGSQFSTLVNHKVDLKINILTTSKNFTIPRAEEQRGIKNIALRLINYCSSLQAHKNYIPPLQHVPTLLMFSVLSGDKGPVLLCSCGNRNSRSTVLASQAAVVWELR